MKGHVLHRARAHLKVPGCSLVLNALLTSCNKLTCLCKSETHVANYCKYKLSRDREKNPGPPIDVDPNKTIAAPYSQGNELVFGQNCSYKFSLKR